MNSKSKKAKTNWHLVIWPILFAWLAAVLYVFNSDWKQQTATVLPIFMGVGAFVVLLLNGFAGSVAQRRLDLEALDGSQTFCMTCHKTDAPLHVVDYHWYLFLILLVVQFGLRGKYCSACARTRVDGMFRRTLFGSMLCPPIIAWAWFQRRRILARIGSEGSSKLGQTETIRTQNQ